MRVVLVSNRSSQRLFVANVEAPGATHACRKASRRFGLVSTPALSQGRSGKAKGLAHKLAAVVRPIKPVHLGSEYAGCQPATH